MPDEHRKARAGEGGAAGGGLRLLVVPWRGGAVEGLRDGGDRKSTYRNKDHEQAMRAIEVSKGDHNNMWGKQRGGNERSE